MKSRRIPARQPASPGSEIQPWAASHTAGHGSVGVLLCHGFTGSPVSLRPWGDFLAAQGCRVSVPRLPGHGTHWRDLNLTAWPDWYARAEQEFNILRRECSQVFVAGLSMGGALALRLAERYGADVAGLMLVNPAISSRSKSMLLLPALSRVIPSIGGIANDIARPGADEGAYSRTPLRAAASMLELWADVRAHLSRVSQPLLLMTSTTDHVVDSSSAERILADVTSTDITRITLPDSFHVAVLDHDDQLIFDSSAAFVARLTGS